MPGVTILPGPTILKRNRRARSGHFPRLRQPGRAGLSVRFLQTPHRDSGRWMSHARKYEKKREKMRKKRGAGGARVSVGIKVKGALQGGRGGVDPDRICMLD